MPAVDTGSAHARASTADQRAAAMSAPETPEAQTVPTARTVPTAPTASRRRHPQYPHPAGGRRQASQAPQSHVSPRVPHHRWLPATALSFQYPPYGFQRSMPLASTNQRAATAGVDAVQDCEFVDSGWCVSSTLLCRDLSSPPALFQVLPSTGDTPAM